MEKTLPVPDREELQKLFGPYDRHLKAVRQATCAEIVVRDGAIRMRGSADAVERAHAALRSMIETLTYRGELTPQDVEAFLTPEEAEAEAPKRMAGLPGKIFRPGQGVAPKSSGQAAYLREIDANDIVFSIGPAGTGKTFLAVAKAVERLRRGEVRRIVLVRPAVEAGERLGFLPGDIQAKVNPYLRPIYDSLNAFLEYGQLQRLIDGDVVEIVPLAFMRGRTLDEAFIILDEAQNTTSDQMKMFLTRMGSKSKIVVTGDITQIDLASGKVSGLVEVQALLKGIPGIAFAYLGKADIVRHPLVQRVVEAYEQKNRRR
ncbi:MAG: PhoH family protein [Planctomycetes bacterium]|nr:PhoH family protein [Planctomycetota bacterium]